MILALHLTGFTGKELFALGRVVMKSRRYLISWIFLYICTTQGVAMEWITQWNDLNSVFDYTGNEFKEMHITTLYSELLSFSYGFNLVDMTEQNLHFIVLMLAGFELVGNLFTDMGDKRNMINVQKVFWSSPVLIVRFVFSQSNIQTGANINIILHLLKMVHTWCTRHVKWFF